jgi:hypothetical protein
MQFSPPFDGEKYIYTLLVFTGLVPFMGTSRIRGTGGIDSQNSISPLLAG